ncbi:Peptidoglycan-binding Lysin subgroup [Penicillium digitatum]|uniref:Peptidoglycan-binding Lysin subgroup n=1 Tax=Penicillium digitatum TaxID=36651 RepID=A0A7T6XT42_PENDI|nr:hypothetical protein PDIDSM_953 [Penicillium digitatum]QQK46706.1 Peptidoglycan-binding Lysin subgroup [Penicillium digitatum]
MNSIHILLSLIFIDIATAQSGRGFGKSHDHSLDKRAPFAPSDDGICYTYIIQEGDTCSRLARRFRITTSNIETWNVGSWGWLGCAELKEGDFVCLSSGALPMPVALPQAVCGPQVPGTQRPAKYSDLASLNPCPQDQCTEESTQKYYFKDEYFKVYNNSEDHESEHGNPDQYRNGPATRQNHKRYRSNCNLADDYL